MSVLRRLRQEECKFKALGLQSENLSLKNIFFERNVEQNHLRWSDPSGQEWSSQALELVDLSVSEDGK